MGGVWLALFVGISGALGATVRFGTTEWVARWWYGRFPLATLLINVSGAFLLGFLLTAGGGATPWLAPYRTVLGTGFLGGYTTFSTLSFETDALARHGLARMSVLNGLGSVAAGVVAALIGIALGHLV